MQASDIEQGTDAWRKSRLGHVTASRIADVMSKTKSGKWTAGRKNYHAQLVCERLTGDYEEGFKSEAMQRGSDKEDAAQNMYAFMNDIEVQQVGFVKHPSISMTGASPDGLVGENGLIEIKAPNTATHLDFLLTNKINSKYIKQMQWQMACTSRQWCDFVSFDDRLPAEMQMHVLRVERDVDFIKEIEREAGLFQDEVTQTVGELQIKFLGVLQR